MNLLESKVIENLKKIVGDDYVTNSLSQIQNYLTDETESLIRLQPPEDCVLVKPSSPKEISCILKYANNFLIPVVPRGGGTGVCGGAVPIKPSIILSLERLNKIIELDKKNLMITVEAGASLSDLLESLNKQDKLFFPIHPGDEGAQIGGMVMENAGGTKAVKHGIMRNHVKSLEVVLPTGEIVTLGGKLVKNNMGYDLLSMMIGSEGTLGVITKVTLKLYAKNKYTGTLLISFDDRRDACDSVPTILQEGITPLAVEYMDRLISQRAAEALGTTWPAVKGSVDLMFMLDGKTEDELYSDSEKIVEICENHNAVDSIIAETSKEQKKLLDIRSNAYTPFKDHVADGLDMAVPPSSVPDFFDDITSLAEKYNTTIPAVGHIADGNIHNFILSVNGKLPSYYEEFKQQMYKIALKYGGTITAEHGTGKTRKKYMPLQFTEREIEIMKGVKKAFDPNGILNPGTIID